MISKTLKFIDYLVNLNMNDPRIMSDNFGIILTSVIFINERNLLLSDFWMMTEFEICTSW